MPYLQQIFVLAHDEIILGLFEDMRDWLSDDTWYVAQFLFMGVDLGLTYVAQFPFMCVDLGLNFKYGSLTTPIPIRSRCV